MRMLQISADVALVDGRDGKFLVNRNDQYIGRALETYGEYCGIEADFVSKLISPGDRVIEVGANIGAHSLGIANKVGFKGRVYAYEPQPACFAFLQSQIALNQVGNIVAINKGCADSSGVLWFKAPNYAAPANFGAVELTAWAGAGDIPVEVTTLDDVHDGEHIRLLKMDVEGMEAAVLRGAQRLIERCFPILYLENDRVAKSDALIQLVQGLGYRTWWHITPLYSPNNFFAVANNLYERLFTINMVCIPEHESGRWNIDLEKASIGAPHPLTQMMTRSASRQPASQA